MLTAPPVGLGRVAAGDGVVEVVGHLVQVAGLEPALDAVAVDVDAQRHAVVHGDGQRLRAAHAAEAGGERDGAGQRAAEAAAGDLGEALVGALQDALRADVDPRARRHLPVHREAELLEPAELVPRRPLGHQVGVGDEHPRRPLVGAEHADRLARLHEHRLVVGQALERADHRVEGVPRAGRPGPCRRRRRGRRAARPPPGRGCSSASAAPPPGASPGSSARSPAAPAPAAVHSSSSLPLAPRRSCPRWRPPSARIADMNDRGGSFEGSDGGLGRGQDGARADERLGRGQLRAPASGPDRGRRPRPAARPSAAPVPGRRGERSPQVEPAGGADQLDGQDPAPGWRRTGAACGPPPTPSTRGPPAWRWSGWCRPWPGRPAAGSRPPSPPACSGRSSCRSRRPASGARKGGRPCERVRSSSRSVRRSTSAPRSATAMARKSQT